MTLQQLLTGFWQFNIPAAIIILALITFHFITNGNRFTKKSINYLSGLFLLFLLTFSPLEFFGHYYLFSAHMIQHIVLLLVIPPLLLTGTDKEYLKRILSGPEVQRWTKYLFYPVTAWIIGVGSMWIWHAPLLFMAMMQSHTVHFIEMLSLLIAGVIFSWPVFTPLKFRKLDPLQSALFLFTACIGCTVLGIFITFSPSGFFSEYMIGNNPVILNFLHSQMGLTPDADQEAAGLIMWVPACLIYLTIIMIMMAKWYSSPVDENNIKSDHLNI